MTLFVESRLDDRATSYSNIAMIPKRSRNRSIAHIVCVALTIVTLPLVAQSGSEFTDSLNSLQLPEGYRILNEEEMEGDRKERYEEFKKELSVSSLSAAHQDLLAHTLSTAFKGVLISSYLVTEIIDNETMDRALKTEKMSVLETGRVQHTSNESQSFSLSKKNSPFSYREGIPVDPKSGYILDESDTEITFRFKVDVDFTLADLSNSPIQLPEELIQTERVNLVIDLSVNKDDRRLSHSELLLTKPVRRIFIAELKKLSFGFRYEFIEECGCSAVVAFGFRAQGSKIFSGKFFSLRVLNYSDIQCESPFRYVLPPEDSHVGLLVRF